MIRLVDVDSNVISVHKDLRVALSEMERLTSSGEYDIIMIDTSDV
jgi:hypothetical protein